MEFAYSHVPSQFKGYVNSKDITSLSDVHLVPLSQNVLYENDGTIKTRNGYTLDGQANSAEVPIQAEYDWNTSTGTENNLRFWNGTLEYRYVDTDDTVTWRTLMTGLTATAVLRFAEFWNTTEKIDELLFVDGTSNIYEWGGAIAVIDSVSATTLTKTGSTSWAVSRALTSGTRKFTINGVDYTYTAGETTTTLTGVTPNPTGSVSAGDIAHQTVRTTAFSSFTQPATFATTDVKDLIAVLDNQVYLGYTKSRYIHVSQQNSFTVYTQSSPRLPGEGDTITLDGSLVGFAAQQATDPSSTSAMYMSAGKDYWYQHTFIKSADLTKETGVTKRLTTSTRGAAQSQEFITKVGNEIIFVSNEPALMSLGRVENIETPQTRNISDDIFYDFNTYDFTAGSLKYHQNILYLSLPAEGIVHPRNIKEGFWEAPQVLPSACLAVIGGDLFMHSSAVTETYKLFDGTSDNTFPMLARAYFNYQNYGDRSMFKIFTRFLTEGYMSLNTLLTLVLKYEFGGYRTVKSFAIQQSDPVTQFFQTSADNSLGKYPLGHQPIGSFTDSLGDFAKFRQVRQMTPERFIEIQVGYESDEVDQQWKILAFGPQVSKADAQLITKAT